MKDRQKRLALLLSISLIAGALTGCGQKAEEVETAEDIAIVEASNPEVGSLTLTGDFIATIEPEDTISVFPMGSGEILSVDVEVGDTVEAGQVLATLDDRMAQITMKTAQIGVSTAQLTYDLNYGEAASTILDMNTDTTMDTQEDYVTTNQELIVESMDDLEYYESLLSIEEDRLKQNKKDYDYSDDVEDIMDYANKYSDYNKYDKGSDKYNERLYAFTYNQNRYQAAKAKDSEIRGKIENYKKTIDTLQKTIEDAEDNIDKYYELYAKTATQTELSNGPLREDQKAMSQNSIESANLNVEQAQMALDNCSIKAPVSGVIEAVNIDEHGLASSAAGPAFTISQKNAMFATYYVSEEIRNTFEVGQSITLDKDGTTYDAKVTEIGVSIDAATGLFKIKALVQGDVSKLLSGTKAVVTTNTYHEDNAVIVPYDCVYYEGGEAFVYLVVDGHAKKTFVKTGLSTADSIAITEGISKDDVVVTTWAAQLRDGVAVSVGTADSKAADAETATEAAQE